MFDSEKYKGKISPEVLDGLDRYGKDRCQIGHFLRAVLSNDLQLAMGHADEQSRSQLFEICRYVYNEMPSGCHGTPEIVEKWLAGGASS